MGLNWLLIINNKNWCNSIQSPFYCQRGRARERGDNADFHRSTLVLAAKMWEAIQTMYYMIWKEVPHFIELFNLNLNTTEYEKAYQTFFCMCQLETEYCKMCMVFSGMIFFVSASVIVFFVFFLKIVFCFFFWKLC